MDLIHPEDAGPTNSAIAQATEKGTGFDIEFRIARRDGTVVVARSIGEHIPAHQGGKPRYFGTLVDITELKTTNHQLEERVHARTQELKAAQEEMIRKEKMAILGQLTATVSHELRNPLATIHVNIHNLQNRLSVKDGWIEKSLNRVSRNVQRCDNIINDLLDFSRTKASNPEVVALDPWLEALLDELDHPEWLQVAFQPGASASQVRFDQDRFRRVVINLVDNARQAMSQVRDADPDRPTRITIATESLEDRVEITLTDTGPGIPADVVSRIFEPLFSTKTYGVGLGLPTVKQIMEQEGGGVSITSQEGAGATARIWLPLHVPSSEVA